MPVDELNRPETILVVDDNPLNRLVMESHLAEAGYEVLLAGDGCSALEVFAQREVDLMVLDVAMPNMDGFETCRRLRAIDRGAALPIVFVTALGDAGTYRKAIESGGDDFLAKPVHRVELLLRVKSLLRVKRLERDLACSNRLLGARRDALLQVQEEKRRLTEMIVHDLRGPLACVLSSADFILEQGGVSGSWADVVRDIYTTADQANRMVNDMLDVAQSEHGVLTLQVAPLKLPGLLDDIRCYFRGRERRARRSLVIEGAAGVGTIEADGDLIRRVIENLVENAIRYAPEDTEIRLEVSETECERLFFRLRDRGPGVPAANRQVIFEPYVHYDADKRNRVRSSRGLGLAFCKLAVEAHGGEIWVEENPPNGSAFCFWIPMQRTEPDPGPAPLSAHLGEGEGEKGTCGQAPLCATK